MSSTPPPLPTDPNDVFRQMRPPAPPAKSGGCMRFALIGCGVVLLLLLAASTVLYFWIKQPGNMSRFMGRLMGALETQVIGELTPEVTPEDRESLRQAFASFTEALAAGQIDESHAKECNQRMRTAIADGKVDPNEARELAAALNAAAGYDPEDAGDGELDDAETAPDTP